MHCHFNAAVQVFTDEQQDGYTKYGKYPCHSEDELDCETGADVHRFTLTLTV
jgi:hypothetical protein